VGKATVIHVKFLCDVTGQKLLKSANVLQSCSKNKSGTFLWTTMYIAFLDVIIDGVIMMFTNFSAVC